MIKGLAYIAAATALGSLGWLLSLEAIITLVVGFALGCFLMSLVLCSDIPVPPPV